MFLFSKISLVHVIRMLEFLQNSFLGGGKMERHFAGFSNMLNSSVASLPANVIMANSPPG